MCSAAPLLVCSVAPLLLGFFINIFDLCIFNQVYSNRGRLFILFEVVLDSIKFIWFFFYVVCGPVFSVFDFFLW